MLRMIRINLNHRKRYKIINKTTQVPSLIYIGEEAGKNNLYFHASPQTNKFFWFDISLKDQKSPYSLLRGRTEIERQEALYLEYF